MGINNSGITDKSMTIKGGKVTTDNGHLVLEGDVVCPIHATNYLTPNGLTNPPAIVSTDIVPFVNEGDVIPADLLVYVETTIPRHIRDGLFTNGYIIHSLGAVWAGLATYSWLVTYWWAMDLDSIIGNTFALLATDFILSMPIVGAIYLLGQIKTRYEVATIGALATGVAINTYWWTSLIVHSLIGIVTTNAVLLLLAAAGIMYLIGGRSSGGGTTPLKTPGCVGGVVHIPTRLLVRK